MKIPANFPLRKPLLILLAVALTGSAAGATPEQDKTATGAPVPAARRPKLLRISASVDGSDKIIFTNRKVRCKHLNWSPMTNVMFNGKPWENPGKSPGDWRGFSEGLDLARARIVKRSGRDVIALETTKKGFVLYLDDSPNGAADYSVTIAIPYRE